MNPITKASENKPHLNARYLAQLDRLAADHGSGLHACFLERMQPWRVSMNMHDADLVAFLEEGRHKNIYMKIERELADFQTSPLTVADAPSQAEVFDMTQQGFGAKRKAYRAAVEREEDIKYGAVCAEGHGLAYYGRYTVFLQRTATDAYAGMFILKTDSLYYLDEHLNFDESTYCEDLALRENVLELALTKHAEDLADGCDHALAQHCYARSADDRSYLEAQIYDDILATHIEEVRWPKSWEDEVLDIGRRKLSGRLNFKDLGDYCAWIKYQEHKRIQRKIRNFGGVSVYEDSPAT